MASSSERFARRRVDFEALRRELAGRCFICELLHEHHVVYEDEASVAFLNRYPSLYGHTLVAPKRHLEQVTGDFTTDEYLELQRVVHRVGEALRTVIPTERLYVLSLGSRQGNRHVHWHLAPLPPGVPFEKQQLAAFAGDVLDVPDEELATLAARVREALTSVC